MQLLIINKVPVLVVLDAGTELKVMNYVEIDEEVDATDNLS